MRCTHHWLITDHQGICQLCGEQRSFLETYRENCRVANHGNTISQAMQRIQVEAERALKYGKQPQPVSHLPYDFQDRDWVEYSRVVEAMLEASCRRRR